MTIVIQGHFIVFAIINVLIFAWAITPRRRDYGFLNMRSLVRLCAAVVASLVLWLGYLVWRLWS